MIKLSKGLVLCGAALAAWSASADVKMPAIFSDGMVVQRKVKAPVWGWADTGEKVTVTASWGAEAKAVAAADGTWSTKLKTPKAGGPFTITISGKNTVEIKDVLSGEVWFCSGQSNMDFTLQGLTKPLKRKTESELRVTDYVRRKMKSVKDPFLRHITVPHTTSPYEQATDFEGAWITSSPDTNPGFSGTAFFFGCKLRQELNVPVGLIKCAWGGTRVQPWIPETAYRADAEMAAYYDQEMAMMKKQAKHFDADAAKKKFKAAVKKWKDGGKKGRAPRPKQDPEKKRQLATTLYNGMVSAVLPYAIKGAIWYQGESNAKYMSESYAQHFSAMITGWRKAWGQGDFPFYWAQLAAFRDPVTEPVVDNVWVDVCDQQRRSLKLKNTGMAVLNDIGAAKDIHPRNKPEAGKRLAFWALANDYGVKMPSFSGPLYKSHKIKGDKVLVRFDHADGGLMVGQKEALKATVKVDEPLQHFQIAGADGVWHWADATIVKKDTIEVSHPQVPNPVTVRYAWAMNPEAANLYNQAGLPASLFTTDK